jgi:hypothetical protein
MRSGDYTQSEGVVVAAWRGGEAIAYTFDYDRDGFPDIILENSRVRLFVSPQAGGRAFAFLSKATGANAFNSVGGMRDNFTKRVEPPDMVNLTDWTRAAWLGLYNRPYSFRIVTATGKKAVVRLEYFAPDIYPEGIKLERTLTLAGDESYYLAETALTPQGVAAPQSYALENSVTFKVFNEPDNFRQWFAQDGVPEEFVPSKKVDLPDTIGFVGAIDKRTGEAFALLSLSLLAKSQIVVQPHAATIRMIYPHFQAKNTLYSYRAAYFFGKASREEIQDLYTRLRNGKE